MDALLNIAPTGNNNVTELRNIYDLIEVRTRSLQILDVDARHYGPVLVPVVMNKLPSQFRLEITRKMPPGKWKITNLMECFKQELVARERCAQMNENMSNDFQNKGNPTSSSTLHSQFQNKSISCSYCKGNHPSNHCNVVTDVSARKVLFKRKINVLTVYNPDIVLRINCGTQFLNSPAHMSPALQKFLDLFSFLLATI